MGWHPALRDAALHILRIPYPSVDLFNHDPHIDIFGPVYPLDIFT